MQEIHGIIKPGKRCGFYPLDMEGTDMERTYAANVRGADEIKVCGYVDTIRNKSKMAFIVLKDITGKVQVTVEKNEDPELDAAVNSLTPDSVITVIGKAVESEYVKLGGVEIYPKKIIVESLAAALPIDREARKGHERSSIDQRIDYRWIDLRTEKPKAFATSPNERSAYTLKTTTSR